MTLICFVMGPVVPWVAQRTIDPLAVGLVLPEPISGFSDVDKTIMPKWVSWLARDSLFGV
jgi:hypothetical protein